MNVLVTVQKMGTEIFSEVYPAIHDGDIEKAVSSSIHEVRKKGHSPFDCTITIAELLPERSM
jgi:hypothetical protein